MEFIEIARSLLTEICQAIAIRSRLKQCKYDWLKSEMNDSKTNGEERKEIKNRP